MENDPDTPGTHFARAALRASVKMQQERDAIVEAVVSALTPIMQEHADRQREAVRDGINEAMTAENASLFAQALIVEAQKQVMERSDKLAGGMVRAVLRKLALFLVAGLLVYAVGGWSALAGFGKYVFKE